MLSIKPDHWIRRQANQCGMIEPFEDGQVRAGVISYGLSSFGYDIRVAREFRIFTPATGQLTVIDPKAMDERALQSYQGDVCIIPPNSFCPGPHNRILPHTAQRIGYLRGEINLRPLRHHRQRHPLRAGMGRVRHHRDQQHHTPAGPASTPVKASPRCYFSKAKRRRSPTPTAKENIRNRPVSPCPACKREVSEEEREKRVFLTPCSTNCRCPADSHPESAPHPPARSQRSGCR